MWSAIVAAIEPVIKATDELLTSSDDKEALQRAKNDGNVEIVKTLSNERRLNINFALETLKSSSWFVAGARPVMMWCCALLFTLFCVIALLASVDVMTISQPKLFGLMFETISFLTFGLYGVRTLEKRGRNK